ncbi:MAG: HEPN domain-containing protein [Armatimonadetes bacterium]|nr:HEPN domain-containing protein [Armatimonadota bacterium]
MKPIAAEWIEKAEGDFAMACREMRARRCPSYDGACFHSQQCAEKYMKARLVEADVAVPRTHDLIALLDLVAAAEPGFVVVRTQLAGLTDYAVRYRYPGDSADRDEARQALLMCKQVRMVARGLLGLPE